MRRHANLAIAISVAELGGDMETILQRGVSDIRRDGATIFLPQSWERFDASKRFQPLASIRAVVDQMRDAYRARLDLDAAIEDTAEMQGQLDRANARRWSANTIAQIARDPEIPDAVGPAVVATQPQVSDRTRQSWVRRNVDVVVLAAVGAGLAAKRFFRKSKTIPEEYFDRIESTMTQGARQAAKDVGKARSKQAKARRQAEAARARGEPLTPEIEFELRTPPEAQALEDAARRTREEIAQEPGIARRRAKGIGRDQAEKFNGQATEERNQKVGVDKYRWNTQEDQRVRLEHERREGKIFAWNNPPPDGHPGEPPECRCWASGDFNEAFKQGQLVARTQEPTALRRGRRGPIRPVELPVEVDPGQIAFQREVFEAPPRAAQVAREERDRRFGAGG